MSWSNRRDAAGPFSAGNAHIKHVSLSRALFLQQPPSLLLLYHRRLAYCPVGGRKPDSCVHGRCGGDVGCRWYLKLLFADYCNVMDDGCVFNLDLQLSSRCQTTGTTATERSTVRSRVGQIIMSPSTPGCSLCVSTARIICLALKTSMGHILLVFVYAFASLMGNILRAIHRPQIACVLHDEMQKRDELISIHRPRVQDDSVARPICLSTSLRAAYSDISPLWVTGSHFCSFWCTGAIGSRGSLFLENEHDLTESRFCGAG